MYDDVESDFWKEIFVHMQHKNMVRTDTTRLSLSEAPAQFERFSFAHPDIQAEITNAATYTTWEIFVTPTVKLRLYIQSQIKASLLQVQGGDLVKIADAKFFNNPFPEINEFLSHRNEYQKELYRLNEEHQHKQRQLQLATQFIKAYMMEKFCDKDSLWHLETVKNEIDLVVEKNNEEKRIELDVADWKEKLDSICRGTSV